MSKYYLTNKAVEDLTQIWQYTYKKWSEEQADKYYNDLLNACTQIAENNDLGRKYFNILPDLHRFHINRHLIFFRRVNPDFVEITRILHEKMDLRNRILE